jgi:hypothetical protein
MEETILQRNVPGKWSKQDDLCERERCCDDSIEDTQITDHEEMNYTKKIDNNDTHNENNNYSHVPNNVVQQILEKRLCKPNTGLG